MIPHLSPAVASGPFLFLSGQLAFGEDGAAPSGDIGAQTLQVLSNIERVLAEEGVELSAIVKTTVWLTDASLFPAFNLAYAEALKDHRPARSTVISGLALPGALVEIEAIAERRA